MCVYARRYKDARNAHTHTNTHVQNKHNIILDNTEHFVVCNSLDRSVTRTAQYTCVRPTCRLFKIMYTRNTRTEALHAQQSLQRRFFTAFRIRFLRDAVYAIGVHHSRRFNVRCNNWGALYGRFTSRSRFRKNRHLRLISVPRGDWRWIALFSPAGIPDPRRRLRFDFGNSRRRRPIFERVYFVVSTVHDTTVGW